MTAPFEKNAQNSRYPDAIRDQEVASSNLVAPTESNSLPIRAHFLPAFGSEEQSLSCGLCADENELVKAINWLAGCPGDAA